MVLARRLQRFGESSRDLEELSNIVRAARHYADGMAQQVIADTMKVSVSTISRWLSRAGKEGILETRVIPPPVIRLAERLKHVIGPEIVRTVSVVPNGPDKNTGNLGVAGAAQVMEAIAEMVAQNPSRETITIALSCGTTVTAVIENLIDLLYQRQMEGPPIRQKLEIYPTVLFGDSELDPVYPHTIVAHFGVLGRNAQLTAAGRREPLISAHALQLPEGFYDQEPEKREAFRTDWGLDAFVEKAKQADIFLLGAGNLTNDSYDKISMQLGIEDYVRGLKDDESVVQILYAPLLDDGLPAKEISERIVGVTVNDIRKIAREPGKRVILVAGGDEKVQSLQRVIKFPCYNVLVTDVGVATEAVQRQTSGR